MGNAIAWVAPHPGVAFSAQGCKKNGGKFSHAVSHSSFQKIKKGLIPTLREQSENFNSNNMLDDQLSPER